MDEQILCHVTAFIAHRLHVRLETLLPDTRLREDLGVDGDDAIELLADFAATFGVAMTDFCFARYFGPEASFNPVYYAYILLAKKRQAETFPITISALVIAVAAQRWLPPS